MWWRSRVGNKTLKVKNNYKWKISFDILSMFQTSFLIDMDNHDWIYNEFLCHKNIC